MASTNCGGKLAPGCERAHRLCACFSSDKCDHVKAVPRVCTLNNTCVYEVEVYHSNVKYNKYIIVWCDYRYHSRRPAAFPALPSDVPSRLA